MNDGKYTKIIQLRTPSKRSQTFVIDLISASVLLVVSLAIFFTYYFTSDPGDSLFDSVFEVSNAMSTLEINDLNNEFVRDLFISQKILDVDNTILQQISDFYVRGNSVDAINLTQEIAGIYLSGNIGYEIVLLDNINNVSVSLDSLSLNSKNSSRTVVAIDKRIFGFSGTTPYVHTYTFEVWRR